MIIIKMYKQYKSLSLKGHGNKLIAMTICIATNIALFKVQRKYTVIVRNSYNAAFISLSKFQTANQLLTLDEACLHHKEHTRKNYGSIL